MNENDTAREVVDVHIECMLASARVCLSPSRVVVASELAKRGLGVAAQVPIPVVYEGTRFEIGFRADLVVAEKVIVEIKSLAKLGDVHKKQLLTYLRLSGKRLGLLINFNEVLIKDGITRIVNRMED
jgi:GxxExxY protein